MHGSIDTVLGSARECWGSGAGRGGVALDGWVGVCAEGERVR